VLGPAGVNPAHEVVLVSDNALTPQAALAFLALEQAGHGRVSVLMDSVDEWALRGGELAKEPTKVGAPASPKDITVPPARYVAHPGDGVLLKDPRAAHGEYPTVFVAAGRHAPSRKPEGQVVSLLPGVPPERQRVPLTVSTRAAMVSWFVDGALLGTVAARERVLWTPELGKHEVVVADDAGRKARRVVDVQLAR